MCTWMCLYLNKYIYIHTYILRMQAAALHHLALCRHMAYPGRDATAVLGHSHVKLSSVQKSSRFVLLRLGQYIVPRHSPRNIAAAHLP